MFSEIYKGRRVLVTGHTGFKGSWLCEWLLAMGAEVTGFSLPPPTTPALFDRLGLSARIRRDIRGDVRDAAAFAKALAESDAELVIHMAAQPLVRLSYDIPDETFDTNVMGTVRVLDAVRLSGKPRAVVVVTTDKCYENREWVHSYREEDPMGGHDPYSASKGCAELVVSAYRDSYFGHKSPVLLASARAGNVIGGGDWALDRIVPDCARSLAKNETIPVRNPHATRPWQHVLEPLSGYLLLGARLLANLGSPADERAKPDKACLESGYNFGPALDSNKSVGLLVDELLKTWPGRWENKWHGDAPHEASLLNLATDKAHHRLHWKPVWPFAETIANTASWYRTAAEGAPDTALADLTRSQISTYHAAAKSLGLVWA